MKSNDEFSIGLVVCKINLLHIYLIMWNTDQELKRMVNEAIEGLYLYTFVIVSPFQQ
jgi:hypothetical protein